ncbi:MAG: aryl sulfotransferase [Rhodospirillaceae bacterium]|nr:aryl sulfotransferase [Rhodospirillaceae bacterium]|tara:strand:+ start:8147 stop:9193 length:1047 start_codon:yes stop_codon:yes gene_type:complete
MRPYKFGITEYDPSRACPGFTIFAPSGGSEVFLINMDGEEVHKWDLPGKLGNYGQLLPNGNLLVTERTPEGPKIAPKGGRLLEMDWGGEIIWEHTDHLQHHDFNRCPNGNTLYLAWELIPPEEATCLGGIPGSEHEDGGVYYDLLREVNPDGEIVWEWRMKDRFPEQKYPIRSNRPRHEYAHANTCFLQKDGNILLSWRDLDLIALIDRKSGDLVWEMEDREWGGQHDPRQLENGNITIFANGSEQVDPEFSRVLEINPDTREVVWEYKGEPVDTFFSPRVSGAQRLSNGNTLICEGRHGRLFEVTPEGDIVWEFISPHENIRGDGKIRQIFRALRYDPESPEIGGRV